MNEASWVGAGGRPRTPGSLGGQASNMPRCPRPRRGPGMSEAAPAHPRGACGTGMPHVSLRCHVTLPGSPWPRPTVESGGEGDTGLPGGGTCDVSTTLAASASCSFGKCGELTTVLMQQQS